MRFHQLELPGAYLIQPEPVCDDRGFFARSWCAREFADQGLDSRLVQCSISFNRRRGTIRGLHYQARRHAEDKLVRCTRGAIHDVVVDLRPRSPTRYGWLAVELTADNRLALYLPKGFAHGFQTLLDETEVFYQMSRFHMPEAARGVRWDDPALAINWPLPKPIVSERDRSFAFLSGKSGPSPRDR